MTDLLFDVLKVWTYLIIYQSFVISRIYI